MNLTCAVCGGTTDSKKENVVVTVGWILEKIVKDNGIDHEGHYPRVSMVCRSCWDKKLKIKPDGADYFWFYNKEI
ncbi:MAG: hypothetical protein QXI32_00490 [Candidatus Bathyarchaeia archaeon]